LKADPFQIGDVLKNPKRFVVPIYQRTYAWKIKPHLESFFDQVEAKAEERLNGNGHFPHYMGALLVIPRGTYSFGRMEVLDVVDGQQRLTVSSRSLLPTQLSCEGEEKLGSDSEELGDEPCFRNNIPLCYQSESALADHAHRFDAFESSPSTSKRAVAFCQPGPLFDGSMILLNNIIEILALAQTNSAGESTLGFQGFHCSRIGRGSYPR
jgi:hypothetical protein